MSALRASMAALALLCAGVAWSGAPTVEAALAAQQGKRVTLRLESGEELTGVLAEVGDKAVRLAELSGKEFFDAVVRVEDISAVIYRAKGN